MVFCFTGEKSRPVTTPEESLKEGQEGEAKGKGEEQEVEEVEETEEKMIKKKVKGETNRRGACWLRTTPRTAVY